MTSNLQSVFDELNRKRIDAYYLNHTNEYLYEFTRSSENYLCELTGFTGDTGSIFITKKRAYLFVDSRFTIQAKNEINDKRIKIIEIVNRDDKIDFINKTLDKYAKLVINPKLISIAKVIYAKEKFDKKKIRLIFDTNFLKSKFYELKKNSFKLTCAPLFILDNKYVGANQSSKIKTLLKNIECDKKFIYITSSLEEIAYLTNCRFKLSDIACESVLFDSFMIISKTVSYLYIKDYLDERGINTLKRSKIYVKDIKSFYDDIVKFSKSNLVYLDSKINNYYIYKKLTKKSINLIDSPAEIDMSIKNSVEIRNLDRCNMLDGVAMVKTLYAIKKDITKKSNRQFKTEYDIKKFVDYTRSKIGKSKFLCKSFETIVAYKENSAICHYSPSANNSKRVVANSVLLIDSGGNYLYGSTDITRTISLYKDKNRIPKDLIMHYSLVLNSLINLSTLKFPEGLTGFEIDIIARKCLYDNYLDFGHGTGHGIGYISNIHEGPNRIGPGINKNYSKNEMLPYQLSSNEPGIYIEGKYGIRLENDILTIPLKENEYGSFLGFKTLTLCPFDKDLIDKKYLDKSSIKFLNDYNKLVYNKLSKHLTFDEKKWLKSVTSEV